MTTVMRDIPRIKHTPELEAAAIAFTNAKSPKGLPVNLGNPFDVKAVRRSLVGMGQWFDDPSFFFDEDAAGELTAVENLILVANLYREHLKAGNTSEETKS
jgi:hypothetical protein